MTATYAPTRTSAPSFVRIGGIVCLVTGFVGAAAGLALALYEPAVSVDRFSYPLSAGDFITAQIFFFVHHLGLLAGLLALGRSGVVPPTRAGRLGLWGAVAGMVGLTITELIAISAAEANVDSTVGLALGAAYGVVCTVLGVTLVMLGIAVARAGSWTGWRRWIVLALGGWVFVPMFPALIVTPTDGARLAIAGWMLLFAALGAALLRPSSTNGPPGSARLV